MVVWRTSARFLGLSTISSQPSTIKSHRPAFQRKPPLLQVSMQQMTETHRQQELDQSPEWTDGRLRPGRIAGKSHLPHDELLDHADIRQQHREEITHEQGPDERAQEMRFRQ